MSNFQAILLGLIRGIAEILPISGSGHQKLFEKLLDLPSPDGPYILFDALARLGVLLAILLAFFPTLRSMSRELHDAPPIPGNHHQPGTARRQVLLVLFSILPMLLWLPAEAYLRRISGNYLIIGLLMFVMGFILHVCDHLPKGKRTAQEMTISDAFYLGFAQLLSSLPGMSRSGMTISAGLWRGMSRPFALQFAFLMHIPILVIGFIWQLIQALRIGIDVQLAVPYMLVTVVSFGAGFLSLRFLQYMMRRGRFGSFAYYSWGVGVISMFLFLIA